MKKICVLVLVCIFIFSSCGKSLSVDMFAIPQMPEMHKALVESVDMVLSDGFEFSEPRTGINRQSLQLIDLDGDNESEGVAFLRDVMESHKTFIYIFEKTDEKFILFDIIEGSEQEIYSVSYSDVLSENGYEIIVEWGSAGDEEHTVTVYNRIARKMDKLLEFTARQYSVYDLDSDGDNEFIAVVDRKGETYVDIYAGEEKRLKIIDSVLLTSDGNEILRMKNGKYSQGKNAVFIDRETASGIVTDVIAYENSRFVNLMHQNEEQERKAVCSDINGDGITEIPYYVPNSSALQGNDGCYRWENIIQSGKMVSKLFSYHSFSDSWYMLMPLSWMSTVNVKPTAYGALQNEIIFITRENVMDNESQVIEVPLFSVMMLKGENKEQQATQDGRVIIYQNENAIFSAKIISESYLGFEINEDFLKENFRIIESEWVSEILFA